MAPGGENPPGAFFFCENGLVVAGIGDPGQPLNGTGRHQRCRLQHIGYTRLPTSLRGTGARSPDQISRAANTTLVGREMSGPYRFARDSSQR